MGRLEPCAELWRIRRSLWFPATLNAIRFQDPSMDHPGMWRRAWGHAQMSDVIGSGARRRRSQKIIGWRELIALPDLGIADMKAKIDTGARTTALHAHAINVVENDDKKWVEFVPVVSEYSIRSPVRARLVERRQIKNTSGVADERFVVLTRLAMGGRTWLIEVSLADRERMEFDLILGRTAIRRRNILVDAGRSFLAGPPFDPDS